MNLVVVCNSPHHSKNILGLLNRIHLRNPSMKVIGVSDPANLPLYQKIASEISSQIEIYPLEAQRTTSSTSVPVVQKKSFFDRLVQFALRVNQTLESQSGFLRYIGVLLRESSLSLMLRERKTMQFFLKRKSVAHQLYDRIKPSIVFSFGDRHLDMEVAMLLAARERKIPVVIPYVVYSDAKALIKVREATEEPLRWFPFSWYRFWIGLKFPQQVRGRFFYQHPAATNALYKIGALSTNPWSIGNGLSDFVLLENARNEQNYLREGVPSEKIRVLGDPTYDELYENLRTVSETRKNLGLDESKPVIVIALPQYFEQGLLDWETHLKETHFTLKALKETQAQVVVSLHPRMDPQKYSFIQDEYEFLVSPFPLKKIIPVADLFVSTNSSTVFWSLICGIPALVMNFIGFDLTMFKGLDHVYAVDQKQNFPQKLRELLSAKKLDFSRDWKLLSRDVSLDGQVLTRYEKLFQELSKQP